MKSENNWQHKTLENLEKKVWPALNPDEGSHLIKTCNALRKKQLKDFTIEDLRQMIGLDIGLKYLIPMAIEILKSNILAEGDLYEGDLLKSVLTSDKEYWKSEKSNWRILCELFESNRTVLKEFDTMWELRNGWFNAFKEFEKVN